MVGKMRWSWWDLLRSFERLRVLFRGFCDSHHHKMSQSQHNINIIIIITITIIIYSEVERLRVLFQSLCDSHHLSGDLIPAPPKIKPEI